MTPHINIFSGRRMQAGLSFSQEYGIVIKSSQGMTLKF